MRRDGSLRAGVERLATRTFALALRLYPPGFRQRFGTRVLEDFTERGRHAWRTRGAGACLGFWLRALLEVPASALRMRARERHSWTFDARTAARSLARSPGYTVVSVVILALGVGGSALVFSVLYGLVLRPLPYADWDRTVVVWTFNQQQSLPDGNSYLNMEDWADRSRTVEAWAWYYRPDFTNRTLTGDGDPRRIAVGAVSASLFSMLGAEPLLGRAFTEAEEQSGAAVVVLSHALWSQGYARDPGVVGRSLELDGSAREIVGVMGPDLELPRAGTLAWEPHSLRTGWPNEKGGRRDDSFVALARLAPGVSEDAARTELVAIAAALRAEHPDANRDLSVLVRPLLEELTGAEIPRTLWLLQVAAILVLIAVGANLAHLWLVRGLGRRRDLAVQLALGAGRGRLVRLLFAEGLLLTGAATILGPLAAVAGLAPLIARLPESFPRVSAVSLDPVVVGVTAAVALAVGGAAALVSAVVATRLRASSIAGDGRLTVRAGRVRGLRSGFVVLQMALATVLVASAALFVRSVERLESADVGLDPSGVLVARIELSPDRYQDWTSVEVFRDRVLDEVRAMPGIESAGVVTDFMFRRFPDGMVTPEGREAGPPTRSPLMVDWVSPGFIETVRMPLLSGRAIEPGDRAQPGEGRNVVINEAMARVFWPDQDALGKRFQYGAYREDKAWHRVVGIVADSRRGRPDAPAIPQVFTELTDWDWDLTVRVAGDPLDAVPAVKEAVARVDPQVALASVAAAEDLIGRGLAPWKLRTLMGLLAAGLVVALAMLGMYGLLNESVLSRRFEIGVRLALGAQPGALGQHVLARGVRFAVTGVALGIVIVIAAAGVLSSFVFGVGALDPLALTFVVAGLLVLAALASWIPARRATRVDPVQCLTGE